MLYMNELTEFLHLCNEIELLLFLIYIWGNWGTGMLYFAAQLLKPRKQATDPRVQTQGYPSSNTGLVVEPLVDLIRKKKNLTTICNTFFWGKCVLSSKSQHICELLTRYSFVESGWAPRNGVGGGAPGRPWAELCDAIPTLTWNRGWHAHLPRIRGVIPLSQWVWQAPSNCFMLLDNPPGLA